MHPVICKIGPFTVFSYGLMLAVAFLIASSLAAMQARRQGVSGDIILNLAFVVFVAGVIGARIFYVTEHFEYYLRNCLEVIMLQYGGLSWFGGLFLGSAAGIFYLRRLQASVYKTVDLLVPFVALGQAIGRIGCFLNGCCFGKVSEFGLYNDTYQAPLIPTQIYSSCALLVIFVILRFLQDKPHRDGEIFLAYLLLYSTKRFLIEFWRGDSEILFAGLTLFQILSLAVLCVAFVKYLSLKRTSR
ncbi:MAG TPA: prolipoprotein diacylglyceryl transferase [Patescibacteria group bacterium]|nr:prolipoprotein diacylglyceryl transferase [Patescibacteria group bacterium]